MGMNKRIFDEKNVKEAYEKKGPKGLRDFVGKTDVFITDPFAAKALNLLFAGKEKDLDRHMKK